MATNQVDLYLLLVASVFLATSASTVAPNEDRKVVVCYYTSWAVYRPDVGKFDVEDINPFLCTHIIYGFADLNNSTGIMASFDPFNDLYDNGGKGAFERFTKLKEINPDLKAILAIGGPRDRRLSTYELVKYSKLLWTAEKRKTFLVNAVDFLKKYGFDGLDFFWRFPLLSSHLSWSDKESFANLLAEMREIFDEHGLMMTAAASGIKEIIDLSYDIPVLGKYLDHIHVMTFDYYDARGEFTVRDVLTGHNAPLYWGPGDLDLFAVCNANFTMNYWLQNGAPKEKLVMGMPLYGRTFTLDYEDQTGLHAPASEPGIAGPYTNESGFLGYNEICDQMKANPSAWPVTRDPYYMAPYTYNGRQWIGYDDMESLKIKAQFAANNDFKGVMVFNLETDDFHGGCHGKKFPLMNAIWEGLGGVIPTPPDTPPTDIPTFGPSEAPPTTTSTTTTVAPSTPTEICKKEGLNPDPTDCAYFYLCTLDKKGEWNILGFGCAVGTVFDPINYVCTWPADVPGNFDFINILSYDYLGNWERTTGLAAPLHFDDPLTPDAAGTIEMYLSNGVPSDMIVMGIPAFAQTQTLANPNYNDIGESATGPGENGPLTQQPGFLGYNEIVESLVNSPDLWVTMRYKKSNAPYSVNWLLWTSYDDVELVKTKAAYINKNNLGGAMVFTIDTDDFHGVGGTIFPIVRTLYNTLVSGSKLEQNAQM